MQTIIQTYNHADNYTDTQSCRQSYRHIAMQTIIQIYSHAHNHRHASIQIYSHADMQTYSHTVQTCRHTDRIYIQVHRPIDIYRYILQKHRHKLIYIIYRYRTYSMQSTLVYSRYTQKLQVYFNPNIPQHTPRYSRFTSTLVYSRYTQILQVYFNPNIPQHTPRYCRFTSTLVYSWYTQILQDYFNPSIPKPTPRYSRFTSTLVYSRYTQLDTVGLLQPQYTLAYYQILQIYFNPSIPQHTPRYCLLQHQYILGTHRYCRFTSTLVYSRYTQTLQIYINPSILQVHIDTVGLFQFQYTLGTPRYCKAGARGWNQRNK